MAPVHRVEQLKPPLGPNIVLVREFSLDRQGIVGCSIDQRSSYHASGFRFGFWVKAERVRVENDERGVS